MSMKSIVFWLLLASLVVLTSCQTEGYLDICLLDKDPGLCKAYMPMWYYNRSSEKCEQFIYGGCQGNANRFETEKLCNLRCVCTQPLDRGGCFARLDRYYYDSSTRRCTHFIYGGCEGNGNRFETIGECRAACE